QGMLEEVTVRSDRDEGGIAGGAQEQLIDACVRAVQKAEAILASLHVEERLDLTVHQELVTKEPVVIEGVVDEPAGRIESLVLDDETNIERPARQPQRRGARVILVQGIEAILVEIEAGEAPVHVRAGDVDGVVVVPVRRVLVLEEARVRPVWIIEVSRLSR